jgi:hypothetical protein
VNWQAFPQYPWIFWAPYQGGFLLHDSRDKTQVFAPDQGSVAQFLADRSNPDRNRMGLGDLVHQATAAVGLERCTPCAERQAALNRAVPNLWRR